MAIATVTRGEVTDLESARAEAAAIALEAASDLEDAQGDRLRAEQDQAMADTYANSLAAKKFGAHVVAAARAMGDAAQIRKQAADQRVEAAETRSTKAQEIVTALHTPEGARA